MGPFFVLGGEETVDALLQSVNRLEIGLAALVAEVFNRHRLLGRARQVWGTGRRVGSVSSIRASGQMLRAAGPGGLQSLSARTWLSVSVCDGRADARQPHPSHRLTSNSAGATGDGQFFFQNGFDKAARSSANAVLNGIERAGEKYGMSIKISSLFGRIPHGVVSISALARWNSLG
jgi:hypothetical protein